MKGEVTLQGSKNAALPILAATLLTTQECVLERVPRTEDIFRMIELLKGLGVKVDWQGDHTLKVKAANIDPTAINFETVGLFRASILLIGPLLARCKQFNMPGPGGCQIGARSIDTHLDAFSSLGAKISKGEVSIGKGEDSLVIDLFSFDGRPMKAAEIVLDEFSVTATENILLASVLLPGETVIKLAAAEPNVQDLCHFLVSLGASIEGIGTHTLKVRGLKSLDKPVRFRISTDINEMGTFLAAAAVTQGDILVHDVVLDFCDSVLKKARDMGVGIEIMANKRKGGVDDEVSVRVWKRGPLRAVRIQTMPYPGFPTDLQAPFGVLATQAQGLSLIHDPLYEGRLRYLDELAKMGAKTFIADPHRAIVSGPTQLAGQEIQTFDIRAGATLIIAGLAAKGRTILHNSYQVDRGYERLDERLGKLGARIIRRDS